MNIKPIFLLKNYFEQHFYDGQKTIDKASLDAQFNTIVNYLNQEFVPKINKLLPEAINPEFDNAGALLFTKDNQVEWKKVTAFDIEANTFKLDHFYSDLNESALLFHSPQDGITSLKGNGVFNVSYSNNILTPELKITPKINAKSFLGEGIEGFSKKINLTGKALGQLSIDNFFDKDLFDSDIVKNLNNFIPFELLENQIITGNLFRDKISHNLSYVIGVIPNINITVGPQDLASCETKDVDWVDKLQLGSIQYDYVGYQSPTFQYQHKTKPSYTRLYVMHDAIHQLFSKVILDLNYPLDTYDNIYYYRYHGSILLNSILKQNYLEDKDLTPLGEPKNIHKRITCHDDYWSEPIGGYVGRTSVTPISPWHFLGCVRSDKDVRGIVQRRHIAKNHLKLSYFEPEIQEVLREFGVTERD